MKFLSVTYYNELESKNIYIKCRTRTSQLAPRLTRGSTGRLCPGHHQDCETQAGRWQGGPPHAWAQSQKGGGRGGGPGSVRRTTWPVLKETNTGFPGGLP